MFFQEVFALKCEELQIFGHGALYPQGVPLAQQHGAARRHDVIRPALRQQAGGYAIHQVHGTFPRGEDYSRAAMLGDADVLGGLHGEHDGDVVVAQRVLEPCA